MATQDRVDSLADARAGLVLGRCFSQLFVQTCFGFQWCSENIGQERSGLLRLWFFARHDHTGLIGFQFLGQHFAARDSLIRQLPLVRGYARLLP
jgi:hypothetical protein